MKIWAIIPVKSLPLTKSRLTAVLTPQERADLTQQLVKRLLNVLNSSEAISEIVVVSRDETIQQLARPLNAITIAEAPEAGLNKAVQTGAHLAAMGKADRILICPSDLPYLTSHDVALVCETAVTTPSRCIICPDRHESGTNALLIPPNSRFQFQFGENSFSKHQQEARRVGLGTAVLRTPGWQFDLDTAEDWKIYAASERQLSG